MQNGREPQCGSRQHSAQTSLGSRMARVLLLSPAASSLPKPPQLRMLFKRHALHYWRLPECEIAGVVWALLQQWELRL